MLGSPSKIVVAFRWIEFDADDQPSFALDLLRSHDVVTRLIWKTVGASKPNGNRKRFEDELPVQLRIVVRETAKVMV